MLERQPGFPSMELGPVRPLGPVQLSAPMQVPDLE
jgi:hypothetical protein